MTCVGGLAEAGHLHTRQSEVPGRDLAMVATERLPQLLLLRTVGSGREVHTVVGDPFEEY